jgi:hypothetical protein
VSYHLIYQTEEFKKQGIIRRITGFNSFKKAERKFLQIDNQEIVKAWVEHVNGFITSVYMVKNLKGGK